MKNNKKDCRDLWDYNKRSNIHVSGIQEGDEKQEVWKKKSPNLARDISL